MRNIQFFVCSEFFVSIKVVGHDAGSICVEASRRTELNLERTTGVSIPEFREPQV